MPAKPWATGKRLTFLTSRQPAYVEALKCGSKPQFITKLHHDWFAAFAWDLPNHLEPGSEYERLPESDKKDLMVKKKISLTRWYYSRVDKVISTSTADQRSGSAGGFPPVVPSSLSLSNPTFKIARLPKPRKKQCKHMYSKHYYKDRIDAVVASRWKAHLIKMTEGPNEPTISYFQMSQTITKEMWESESPEVKSHVEEERKIKLEKDLLEYSAAETAMNTAEAYQKAIDNMMPYVSTFLKGLAERTGLSVTIAIGGPIPADNGRIGIYHCHHGVTANDDPVNFGEFAHAFLDTEFFAKWSEFLKEVYPRDERDLFYSGFTQTRDESPATVVGAPSAPPTRSTTPETRSSSPFEPFRELGGTQKAPDFTTTTRIHTFPLGGVNSCTAIPDNNTSLAPAASNDAREKDGSPTSLSSLPPGVDPHTSPSADNASVAPTPPNDSRGVDGSRTSPSHLPSGVGSRAAILADDTSLAPTPPNDSRGIDDSPTSPLPLPSGVDFCAAIPADNEPPVLALPNDVQRVNDSMTCDPDVPLARSLCGGTAAVVPDIVPPALEAPCPRPAEIDYEAQRLKNIQENILLMEKLGLGVDTAIPTSRKRLPSKRKREADSNRVPTRTTRPKPNTSAIELASGVPNFSKAELEGVPPWLILLLQFVSHNDLGREWMQLTKTWLSIEKGLEYSIKSSRLFIPKYRPLIISMWMAHGRKTSSIMTITNIDEFSELWWKWWGASQPPWRSRNEDGELLQVGSGDWSSLKVGGNNGLLLFIVALLWWGKAVVDSDNHMWVKAVKDMQWALEGCVSRTIDIV